jgi:hypothetical protein
MLSIVNTDPTNGMAVKIRFRGAANSDDLLDFTVLLSPSDVWTASLDTDANGLARVSTADNSCTIPANINASPQSFGVARLASYLTTAQQNANTREGYVEILNMANIPPTLAPAGTGANPLYTAIKHVNGVPPCTQGPIDNLLDDAAQPAVTPSILLTSYGLDTPTGGLFGTWAILNQQTLAQFSGGDTAVRAVSSPAGTTAASINGYTYVAFGPQNQDTYGANANFVTADPLLTQLVAGVSAVTPMQVDVPDLSTPLLPDSQYNPTLQAYRLSAALGKTSVSNEFANDPTGASSGVPFSTDWVVSQPTRRYFAVVNY